ncbi:lysozyme inhibitor LprI family protein [Pantoea sp. B65]|uniref:lysozyme inhibitor LprI family protein n=1 Tax=Pantoea sp. B65 TaxID=2813359 RepID=UPI0039B5E994
MNKIIIKSIQYILLLVLHSAVAAENPLTDGNESTICYSGIENRHEGENCIEKKWSNSNKDVNREFKKTLNAIKNNPNYTDPFNSKSDESRASVYQKRLLQSQETWEKYKKEFCLAIASAIGDEDFDYQPTIKQCEINMNKRRIEEINMMGETQPSLPAS